MLEYFGAFIRIAVVQDKNPTWFEILPLSRSLRLVLLDHWFPHDFSWRCERV